jgi:hypothetical protein
LGLLLKLQSRKVLSGGGSVSAYLNQTQILKTALLNMKNPYNYGNIDVRNLS